MLTQQQIYDRVCEHLLKQGSQSVRLHGGCAYRGTDNKMCAVGCLIAEEHYKSEMEGKTIFAIEVLNGLVASKVVTEEEAKQSTQFEVRIGHSFSVLTLLDKLQSVHDYDRVDRWQENLNSIATQFGLTPYQGAVSSAYNATNL